MSFLFYLLGFAGSDFELRKYPNKIKETIENADVVDVIDE